MRLTFSSNQNLKSKFIITQVRYKTVIWSTNKYKIFMKYRKVKFFKIQLNGKKSKNVLVLTVCRAEEVCP
jgi:hypothetical protein